MHHHSDATTLAVIGAGSIGSRHAELVSQQDFCALVAICDSNPQVEAVANRCGVPFYRTLGELLCHEQPQGAIIATPSSAHADTAVACAQQGIHVLIEKPIADTLTAARRVIDAAQQTGIAVLVGHHRRHNQLLREAREVIQRGELGPLVGVSVLWAICKPTEYYDLAWRRQPPSGGPALINLIHDLDSLRFLCGEIEEVYARASSAARQLEVEDSLAISIGFANGMLGSILASDATPSPWSYEATAGENPHYFHTAENCYHILGTAGSLAFPQMEIWRYGESAQRGWQFPLTRHRLPVPRGDPLIAQLAHFCRVLNETETPLVDARDGAQSLAVALAVLESAASGRPVTVPAT